MENFLSNNVQIIGIFAFAILSFVAAALANINFNYKAFAIENSKSIKRIFPNILFGIGILLISIGIVLLFINNKDLENDISINETPTPEGEIVDEIEFVRITGINFSSSCFTNSYSVLAVDFSDVNQNGIPVYDDCNLKFYNVTISSPDKLKGYLGRVEFYANEELIGTTEERYFDKYVTKFSSINVAKYISDDNNYNWDVQSGWGTIDAYLVYSNNGNDEIISDIVKIKLDRQGTSYLLVPSIIKIQSITYKIGNEPSITYYPGSTESIEISPGDVFEIESIKYKPYVNSLDNEIYTTINYYINKGTYYSSGFSNTTDLQKVGSQSSTIDGFPVSFTFVDNGYIAIYLRREDSTPSDYIRIPFEIE